MNTIRNKLMMIQSELKAPKNLRNTFGGYNYRNAEGILEAFKPVGLKYGVALALTDEIIEVGNRFYVKATATIMDIESDASISMSAFAREPESKKGMDECQITGAASSYARKYALNGLLLLDDTKDADSDEYQRESEAKSSAKKAKEQTSEVIDAKTLTTLRAVFTDKMIDERFVCDLYKIKDLESTTMKQYQNIMSHIDDIKTRQEGKK